MKTFTFLFFVAALILSNNSTIANGLYKWTDAKGNTQYGDQPPANSNAKPMDLPKITIIDNYAEQWKPIKFNESEVTDTTKQKTPSPSKTSSYTKLEFLAPKANQGIRANNGDVTAMISIKPPLKKGHKIIFSIDGKATAATKSRTKNFPSLDRGSHTISVKIVSASGKTLKSNSVGFNVLRASVASINDTQGNQNPENQTINRARSYNSVRQQQLQNSN